MPRDASQDDSMVDLLCDALDGDDAERRVMMVALMLMGSPTITDQDRDRLRSEGIPPVFRL